MCSARASNFSQGTGSTLYLQKKQWGEENEGELMGGVLAAAVVVSNDTRKRTRWGFRNMPDHTASNIIQTDGCTTCSVVMSCFVTTQTTPDRMET